MITRLLIGIAIGAGLGAVMGHFGKCSTGACPLTANPYRGAIYGGVLGALFSVSLTGGLRSSSGGAAAAASTNTVHIATAEDFKQHVMQAEKPVLADFYSNGCGPCRMLAPTIDRLADKYRGRALVCKVSLDAAPELARHHGISGIPAVLFFEGGREVRRLIGLQDQGTYERVLESLLTNNETSLEKEAPDAHL